MNSATSVKLGNVADNPTILIGFWIFSPVLIALATKHSSTRPRSSFSKWISSIIKTFTRDIIPSVFLVTTSHFSGVVIRTSAFFRDFRSGVTSPVNSKTDFYNGPYSSLLFQSIILSFARAFKGAINMILWLGICLKTLNIASSDIIVLPEPVGAPIKTFESVWNNVWNT